MFMLEKFQKANYFGENAINKNWKAMMGFTWSYID
jgi:hypothetical protein